jgi:hypothetical protein
MEKETENSKEIGIEKWWVGVVFARMREAGTRTHLFIVMVMDAT